MIDYLQGALIIVPFFLSDHHERMAAFTFAGGSIVHTFLFGAHDSGIYYLSAAIIDMVVIMLLFRQKLTDMAVYLALLSVLTMGTNALGWVFYDFYIDPAPYNYCFITLYIAALAIMLTGGPDGKGISCQALIRRVIRVFTNKGLHSVAGYEGAAGL